MTTSSKSGIIQLQIMGDERDNTDDFAVDDESWIPVNGTIEGSGG